MPNLRMDLNLRFNSENGFKAENGSHMGYVYLVRRNGEPKRKDGKIYEKIGRSPCKVQAVCCDG